MFFPQSLSPQEDTSAPHTELGVDRNLSLPLHHSPDMGAPTAKELKIVDPRAFANEQKRLKQSVREFHEGGESKCTTNPHPFFGPLTPLEWSTGMYKHVDHHLRQFGA